LNNPNEKVSKDNFGELAPAVAGMASQQVSGGIIGLVSLLRGSVTPVDDCYKAAANWLLSEFCRSL